MMLLSNKSESRLFLIITLIIYMLKVIGLAPFTPGVETSAGNSRRSSSARVLRFSKTGLAYNVLFLVLLKVMDVIALPTFVSVPYPNSSSVTHAIDVVQGATCALATYIIVLSWTLQQKNGVSVMNRLLEVDRLLSGIEKEPCSKNKMFVSLALHTIFNALLWFTARTAGALMVSGALLWSFYTVSHLVIYWFIVEYFLVVSLLAKELERVNNDLLKLRKLQDRLFRTFLNDYLAVLNFSDKSRTDSLKLLLDIRTELYEISKEIAGLFSFPILVAISYFYLLLVYNVYYLISILTLPNQEFPMIAVFNGAAWIMTVVYSITLLALSVKKAGKEAKLTGSIVHKLLATAMNPEIKFELKRFSLQLLHERLRFTAYGFFTLDCTLLHSILEATAMYNVILIQFSRTGKTSVDSPDHAQIEIGL